MADYQHGVAINIVDTFRLAGVPTDPTAVVYTIRGPDGTTDTFTWPGAPEISHPGVGEFVLSVSPPADAGLYTYDVDATGTVTASRAGSFNVLANATTITDEDWAVLGPCTPWASSQDAWYCCGQPTIEEDGEICNVDFSSEVMAASQILFELSGRLFAGICEKTVRPCASEDLCGVQMLSRGYVIGWNGSHWGHGCGCSPMSRILLSGYPVREITEVLIDGDVVDPATYRLDERRYLTRMRDVSDPDTILSWPSCQIMDLPDTEDGTFSVTYRYGQDPPLVAVDAAAELACQLYRACNSGSGGECVLPSGVTRLTRQGVTVERPAFTAWGLKDGSWQTGLQRVDAFLNSYNPQRQFRRPMTWSPDGLQYARPVGQ